MKFSYNWLQTYFDESLPDEVELEELLTFHSSEIEEVVEKDNDFILDVKVLPDKSSWLLSHRGLAREIATITGRKLKRDPLKDPDFELPDTTAKLNITLDHQACDFYSAVIIEGVEVGPSPDWLRKSLEAIGQRSINNVVDATNYVMFDLGQPLHAFCGEKLSKKNDTYSIGVRMANDGERITVLTGEEYSLTNQDLLIVDKISGKPIGIAGIKGGAEASVDENTGTIVVESAHFDRVSVRKSSTRLKLRTDASSRFENGVVNSLAPIGLKEVAKLITDIAGGEVVGFKYSGEVVKQRDPVSFSLEKLNRLIGFSMTEQEVSSTLNKFSFVFGEKDGFYTIIPPFERDDLNLAEDCIEEVARVYGLSHVESVPPELSGVPVVNKRHYYAVKIRRSLSVAGWSEVFTSSFRDKDEVKLKNALASDKSCLRSSLGLNVEEAVTKNLPHKDLLGLTSIKIYELGVVFNKDKETYNLALGARTNKAYKAKTDEALLVKGMEAVKNALGVEPKWQEKVPGVMECVLDELIEGLPTPQKYEDISVAPAVTYQSPSNFPSVSRDIALFVNEGVTASAVEAVLNEAGGNLRVRTTLFDEFHKDGRISYAFRLVFLSRERTLTDSEVNQVMEDIYASVETENWEVR